MGRPLDTRLELADSLKLDLVRSQSLNEAIELAKKSRGDVQVQARRIEKERLNDRAIHSERLPSIALFADLGALNTNADRPVATHMVGFSMRFPVFDGGRRAARRAEAQSKIRSEQLRRKQIEDQLELEVRQSIRRLQLSKGQVEVAEPGRSLAQEELARAPPLRGRRDEQFGSGSGTSTIARGPKQPYRSALRTQLVADRF